MLARTPNQAAGTESNLFYLQYCLRPDCHGDWLSELTASCEPTECLLLIVGLFDNIERNIRNIAFARDGCQTILEDGRATRS